MEIKKVANLGAGAVGSYVIEGISGCREIRLGVIVKIKLQSSCDDRNGLLTGDCPIRLHAGG